MAGGGDGGLIKKRCAFGLPPHPAAWLQQVTIRRQDAAAVLLSDLRAVMAAPALRR
jgi:hypothetical protein